MIWFIFRSISKKEKDQFETISYRKGAEVTLPQLGPVGIFIPSLSDHLKFIAVAPDDLQLQI